MMREAYRFSETHMIAAVERIDKRTFRKDMLRLYRGDHCKACFYCDGDTEFAKEIPAGEQLS